MAEKERRTTKITISGQLVVRSIGAQCSKAIQKRRDAGN